MKKLNSHFCAGPFENWKLLSIYGIFIIILMVNFIECFHQKFSPRMIHILLQRACINFKQAGIDEISAHACGSKLYTRKSYEMFLSFEMAKLIFAWD